MYLKIQNKKGDECYFFGKVSKVNVKYGKTLEYQELHNGENCFCDLIPDKKGSKPNDRIEVDCTAISFLEDDGMASIIHFDENYEGYLLNAAGQTIERLIVIPALKFRK